MMSIDLSKFKNGDLFISENYRLFEFIGYSKCEHAYLLTDITDDYYHVCKYKVDGTLEFNKGRQAILKNYDLVADVTVSPELSVKASQQLLSMVSFYYSAYGMCYDSISSGKRADFEKQLSAIKSCITDYVKAEYGHKHQPILITKAVEGRETIEYVVVEGVNKS